MLHTASGQRIYPFRCIEEGVRYLRLHPKQAVMIGLCLGIIALAAIVFFSVPTNAARAMGMIKAFQWVDKLGISMAARWGIAGGIVGMSALLILMISVEWLRQNAIDHRNLLRHQRRSVMTPVKPQHSGPREIAMNGTLEEKQNIVIKALGGQKVYDSLPSIGIVEHMPKPYELKNPIIKGTLKTSNSEGSLPFIALRYSAKEGDSTDKVAILCPHGIEIGDKDDSNWYCEQAELFKDLPEEEDRFCLTSKPNSAALNVISQIIRGEHPLFESI